MNANPEDNTFSVSVRKAAEQGKENADKWFAVFGTGYPDQDDRADNGNPLDASFGFEALDNVDMN